jgi:hypothetical protein
MDGDGLVSKQDQVRLEKIQAASREEGDAAWIQEKEGFKIDFGDMDKVRDHLEQMAASLEPNDAAQKKSVSDYLTALQHPNLKPEQLVNETNALEGIFLGSEKVSDHNRDTITNMDVIKQGVEAHHFVMYGEDFDMNKSDQTVTVPRKTIGETVKSAFNKVENFVAGNSVPPPSGPKASAATVDLKDPVLSREQVAKYWRPEETGSDIGSGYHASEIISEAAWSIVQARFEPERVASEKALQSLVQAYPEAAHKAAESMCDGGKGFGNLHAISLIEPSFDWPIPKGPDPVLSRQLLRLYWEPEETGADLIHGHASDVISQAAQYAAYGSCTPNQRTISEAAVQSLTKDYPEAAREAVKSLSDRGKGYSDAIELIKNNLPTQQRPAEPTAVVVKPSSPRI